jgi:hypothetical protein
MPVKHFNLLAGIDKRVTVGRVEVAALENNMSRPLTKFTYVVKTLHFTNIGWFVSATGVPPRGAAVQGCVVRR